MKVADFFYTVVMEEIIAYEKENVFAEARDYFDSNISYCYKIYEPKESLKRCYRIIHSDIEKSVRHYIEKRTNRNLDSTNRVLTAVAKEMLHHIDYSIIADKVLQEFMDLNDEKLRSQGYIENGILIKNPMEKEVK